MEPVKGNFNFKKAAVISGARVTEDLTPMLYVDSTLNKFTLNSKALRAMNVNVAVKDAEFSEETKAGYIAFFDNAYFDDGTVNEDMNNRFLITTGYVSDKKAVGAKVSGKGSFSYSKVWSAIQVNEAGVEEATPESLAAQGLILRREGTRPEKKTNKDGELVETGKTLNTTSYIALNDITYDVVPYVDGEGNELFSLDDSGEPQKIWMLTNRQVSKHTPKEFGKGETTEQD